MLCLILRFVVLIVSNGNHHCQRREAVNSELISLLREGPMIGSRSFMNAVCSAMNAPRSRSKRGAHSKLPETTLRKTGLKPASFMGSRFTRGADWQCINWFCSRARRYLHTIGRDFSASIPENTPVFQAFS